MTLGETKEPGLEVDEGGEGVSFGSELVQPELQDSTLSPGLNLHFGWLEGQPGRRVWKAILEAEVSHSPEP